MTRGRNKARVAKTTRGPQTAGDDLLCLSPDEPVTLAIYLRHRRPVRRRPGSGIDLAELTRRVSLAELEAERRRILAGSVERVRHFAQRHGMTVRDIDFLRRRVTLGTTAAAAERAFATRLRWVDDPLGRRHCPVRKPTVARALADVTHAVVGLDTRSLRLDRLRSHAQPNGEDGLYPSEIARLYGITTAGRGAGQCIALIEPAGGYDPADVAAACKAMHVPVPKIVDVNVGTGRNRMGPDPRADMEVALDVQVVAGIAPEASIAVFFTELSKPGLIAGLSEAVHGKTVRPNVIVITWGEAEEAWPPEARNAFDAVLQDAVRLGITVVASAGDDLATDGFRDANGFPDDRAHVDYPASSPYVLGCGGTQITLDAASSRIVNEVVWNDGRHGTGGGISEVYIVPVFQGGVELPESVNPEGKRGRGVPDVAAAGAPTNGYRIVVGNKEAVNSGTSAVAPLWGAFIALLNEQRAAALGFVNSRLYQLPRLFNRITSGNNIDTIFRLGYEAAQDRNWNACTGLGTPNGPVIIEALTATA